MPGSTNVPKFTGNPGIILYLFTQFDTTINTTSILYQRTRNYTSTCTHFELTSWLHFGSILSLVFKQAFAQICISSITLFFLYLSIFQEYCSFCSLLLSLLPYSFIIIVYTLLLPWRPGFSFHFLAFFLHFDFHVGPRTAQCATEEVTGEIGSHLQNSSPFYLLFSWYLSFFCFTKYLNLSNGSIYRSAM